MGVGAFFARGRGGGVGKFLRNSPEKGNEGHTMH